MLISLLLVPPLIVAYLRLQRRRARLLALYSSQGLAPRPQLRARRRHLPPMLFLLSLIVLLVGLARPQALINLPRLEGTVILAFDVSGSMAADDLKPTRLEAAKAAARAFVARQPSTVQIGVVTFSDGGFATQAPTNDQAAILGAINRLSVQRGTALATGIQSALNAIAAQAGDDDQLTSEPPLTPLAAPAPLPPGVYTAAVVVLLTDGENNADPDPLALAQTAADRGVRIYPVGLASAAGATLQVDGFTVRTRLDEAVLQAIAARTGGAYYAAESLEQLPDIYGRITSQLLIKPQKIEITALLAGASIVLLLAGAGLSLAWFGRAP